MSTELYYLCLTAGLTGVIWIPYIINRMMELGPLNALMTPSPDAMPEAKWAYRMINAHRNALENIVVFAPLVIVTELTQQNTDLTGTLCAIYFFSRLAHVTVYTLGVPVVRTLFFIVGFLCQAGLFIQLIQS